MVLRRSQPTFRSLLRGIDLHAYAKFGSRSPVCAQPTKHSNPATPDMQSWQMVGYVYLPLVCASTSSVSSTLSAIRCIGEKGFNESLAPVRVGSAAGRYCSPIQDHGQFIVPRAGSQHYQPTALHCAPTTSTWFVPRASTMQFCNFLFLLVFGTWQSHRQVAVRKGNCRSHSCDQRHHHSHHDQIVSSQPTSCSRTL